MSVNQRSCVASASVPSEIWLEIFDQATWISGAFDISDDNAVAAFVGSNNNMYLKLDSFYSAMQVSLAVSLVSKTWHSLVQEFMFRYILIESDDRVLQLADLLDDCKARGDNGYMPCRWTRRLEICIRDWQPLWTGECWEALIRISKYCTNITIFSTAFCRAQACCFCANIGYVFKRICANSNLRRLELKDSQLTDPEAFSALEHSLEILYIRRSRSTSSTQKPLALRLPKLHTLIIGFAVWSGLTSNWDMPSLRALSIDNGIELESLLDQVGHHLRSLALQSPYCLSALLSRCPGLHELDINFRGLLSGDPENPFTAQITVHLPSHASIRCVILRNLLLSGPSESLENPGSYLHCHLERILYHVSCTTTFPSLQSIRFIPCLPVGRLQKVLTPWLRSCSMRGIQVQHCHHGGGVVNWLPFTVGLSQ